MSGDEVKKTLFEKLDTVKKKSKNGLDTIIKINALFNPCFAFSDTQLVDNIFRELSKETSVTIQLFEEDPGCKYFGQTLEVCHRPSALERGKISFERVIEDMVQKSKGRPMLFSSLKKVKTNEKLIQLKEEKAKRGEQVTYDDFIAVLKENEPESEKPFDNYIKLLNAVFNEKKHCNKIKWNFEKGGYENLISRALDEKTGLERIYPELRTPSKSAEKFEKWLRDQIEEGTNRSLLYTEGLDKFFLPYLQTNPSLKRDYEIYKQIIDFTYNINLANAHNYSPTEDILPKYFTALYREAGLIGNKSLEQKEMILKAQKKFGHKRMIQFTRKIDVDRLNYDHIKEVRDSYEFNEFVHEFFKEESPIEASICLEEYMGYLSKELPSTKTKGEMEITSGSSVAVFGAIGMKLPEMGHLPILFLCHGCYHVIHGFVQHIREVKGGVNDRDVMQ